MRTQRLCGGTNACAARRHRECLDKYLPRVKIFEYATDGGHK